MQELSYWLIALLLIGLMVWALVSENARLRHRTSGEYEAEVANNKASLLRAGLVELDRFLGETKQKTAAVEYLKDQEQGQTQSGGNSEGQGPTDEEWIN
jgi:hypothetical protein